MHKGNLKLKIIMTVALKKAMLLWRSIVSDLKLNVEA